MVKEYFDFDFKKDTEDIKTVRMSAWDAPNLSSDQQEYAAADVFMTLIARAELEHRMDKAGTFEPKAPSPSDPSAWSKWCRRRIGSEPRESYEKKLDAFIVECRGILGAKGPRRPWTLVKGVQDWYIGPGVDREEYERSQRRKEAAAAAIKVTSTATAATATVTIKKKKKKQQQQQQQPCSNSASNSDVGWGRPAEGWKDPPGVPTASTIVPSHSSSAGGGGGGEGCSSRLPPLCNDQQQQHHAKKLSTTPSSDCSMGEEVLSFVPKKGYLKSGTPSS